MAAEVDKAQVERQRMVVEMAETLLVVLVVQALQILVEVR